MTTATAEAEQEYDIDTIDVNDNANGKSVALYNPIEAGLATLEGKYAAGPPADLSIPAHYESCRLALSETRGIRGKTEKLRKELKADALAYGKLVDSKAKGIVDRVLLIEEPFATAKKEFDTRIEIEKREKALAEERRVDGIAGRIAAIGALVAAHVSSTSEVIAALLPGLNNDLVHSEEWAMEFNEKAIAVIAETMHKLEELHAMKVQQEQFAADKAKAEKEAADKAEADRVQREKEAAAERERLAQERAELERERAAMQIERERLDKEQAERDRIAKEEQAEKDRVTKAIQDEKDRVAREEQTERDRVAKAEQDEKDHVAEAERVRMAAEIEALKKEREQPASEPASRAEPEPISQVVPTPDDNYKAAGQAIMAITGSRPIAKALLDAIIFGNIPNVDYTA